MLNTYQAGNCFELLRQVHRSSVNLVLCDPPYGTTKNEWDVPLDLDALWPLLWRVLKENGVALLFAVQPFTTDVINSQRKHFRYDLVWKKNRKSGFLNAKRMPLRAHEQILVFYQRPPAYTPIKSTGHSPTNAVYTRKHGSCYGAAYSRNSAGGSTERFPSSVLEFSCVDNIAKDRIHPTQKPVPLLEYLIKLFTAEGDTVLDPCAGSGATARACMNTGRRFICMDSDAEMVKKAWSLLSS